MIRVLIWMNLAGLLAACQATAGFLEAEREKNLGVAYLEQELPHEAAKAFRRVIELIPNESLGYADLGLCYLRMSRADSALHWLGRARRLDPHNVDVLLLVAEVQQWTGDWASATVTLQEAQGLRPDDRMVRYRLYEAASAQRGNAEARRIATRELEGLYAMAPANPVVTTKYARLKAEQGDLHRMTGALDLLRPIVVDVEVARRALARVDEAVARGDSLGIRRGLMILENVLRPTSRFKQALGELKAPVPGLPLTRFSVEFYEKLTVELPAEVPVRFVQLSSGALPPTQAMGGSDGQAAGGLDFADVNGDGRDDILVSFSRGGTGGLWLWRGAPGKWASVLPAGISSPTVEARFVDFDNDTFFDVAATGPAGLRLLRGDSTGLWEDVTGTAGISLEPVGPIEMIDADNEGDLDLCVGTPEGLGLWQNRLDGTFAPVGERASLSGEAPAASRILAIDGDDDLDTDLLVVDGAGQLRLFDNLRLGRFAEADRGLDPAASRAVVASDIDNDGWVDLVVVRRDGSVGYQRNTGSGFAPATPISSQGISVRAGTAFDFDNDGWQDLAFAGTARGKPAVAVLRNGGDGTWTGRKLEGAPEECICLGWTDLDGDGDADLLALNGQGMLHGWRNDGGNENHWFRVRLQGLRTAGTKNNLYGIGCKVEVKAGLHYQMKHVRRPVTRFGLGAQDRADLLRVMWSNGVPQNQFQAAAEQTVFEPQILKGSCPYLYCWDGKKFAFVTDLLAAAPLGLQLAEGVIAPDNPRELMTIPRDRIGPQGGKYVFQYTSELWETVYLDEVALRVVDHPQGTEVFTDQRFLPPPYGAPHPIFTRGRVLPVRAEDTEGRDVTGRLLEFDHLYPEVLRPTRYQGIVEPHTLTLHFGDVRHLSHPLLAIGCWIFWTDTSINISLSQGKAAAPHPTSIEVWGPGSGWTPLEDPFGLPNGKDKWAVLDFSDVLYLPDARVRLRTGSQIYWDQAFLADAAPAVPNRTTRLSPVDADVHYGGFSRLYRPTEDGPHLYDYDEKIFHPVWMDMRGLTTRYGDVTDLLTAADDRFVIFTGGDEVTIRFDASGLPPLERGWQRDFLFYSDGWEKDSDRNTVTGDTVEPLPFHGMSAYPYPASESYPQDAVHRAYLQTYQTRRIGPEAWRAYVKEYAGGDVPPLPWELEPGTRGMHGE